MKKIFYCLVILFALFIFTPQGQAADNHYLERALSSSGKAVIWKNMPITVYVEDSGYRNQIIEAFRTWQNSSGGIVKFAHANGPNAGIIVGYSSNLPGSSVGITSKNTSNGEITHAKILLKQVPYSPKLENFVYSVALHEVGHALGIEGHSSSTGDIMYPQTTSITQRQALSSRDITTLKWLYNVKQDFLNQHTDYIKDSKIAESEAYVRKYPNSTVGWSNLGGVYVQYKMYNKAEAAYNRALSINPQAFAVYWNLALCYTKQGKYEEAYNAQEKAFLLNNNDIRYLDFLARLSLDLSNNRALIAIFGKKPEHEKFQRSGKN